MNLCIANQEWSSVSRNYCRVVQCQLSVIQGQPMKINSRSTHCNSRPTQCVIQGQHSVVLNVKPKLNWNKLGAVVNPKSNTFTPRPVYYIITEDQSKHIIYSEWVLVSLRGTPLSTAVRRIILPTMTTDHSRICLGNILRIAKKK